MKNRLTNAMNKVLLIGAITLGVSLASQPAHAVSGWFGATTVTKVYAAPGDSVLVTFGTMSGLCGSGAHQAYIGIDVSTETGKAAYQAVLAAYLSGRQVKYRVSDTCGYYASLFNVELQ
jgi:hypothetical protein